MDHPIPTTEEAPKTKKKLLTGIFLLLIVIIIIGVISTQITFYTIPPIGAIPKGITIVMWRGSGTQLFDSPDALCERTTGKVTLLCRGIAIGAIKDATEITRIPYVDQFYLWSTGGMRYSQ